MKRVHLSCYSCLYCYKNIQIIEKLWTITASTTLWVWELIKPENNHSIYSKQERLQITLINYCIVGEANILTRINKEQPHTIFTTKETHWGLVGLTSAFIILP